MEPTPHKKRRRDGRSARRKARESGARSAHLNAPAFIERKVGVFTLLDEEGLQCIESNADRILAEVGMDFRGDPE
ncbi:MAG: trimethylamine methyltransferase family protein, partial [Gammaproteobacteria bacterium]